MQGGIQTFKAFIAITHNFSQKIKAKEYPNLLYEAFVTLILKLDKIQKKTELTANISHEHTREI